MLNCYIKVEHVSEYNLEILLYNLVLSMEFTAILVLWSIMPIHFWIKNKAKHCVRWFSTGFAQTLLYQSSFVHWDKIWLRYERAFPKVFLQGFRQNVVQNYLNGP